VKDVIIFAILFGFVYVPVAILVRNPGVIFAKARLLVVGALSVEPIKVKQVSMLYSTIIRLMLDRYLSICPRKKQQSSSKVIVIIVERRLHKSSVHRLLEVLIPIMA
jgi:hypothetical protein